MVEVHFRFKETAAMNRITILVLSLVGMFAIGCSSAQMRVSPSSSPISPLISPLIARPPAEQLDLKSPDSIVKWLEYSLNATDMQVFDLSTNDLIRYGPCESEWTGSFTKELFLDEVKLRISSQPKCASYKYDVGTIKTLYVLTSGWNPSWDLGGGIKSEHLTLIFSDQDAESTGFFLAGVCITTMPPPFPDGIPCS